MMGTVSLRKLSAVIAVALLILCVVGTALVQTQKAFAAGDLMAGQAPALTAQATEQKNVAIIKKFVKSVNALPAASKVKLVHGKKVNLAKSLYVDALGADLELLEEDETSNEHVIVTLWDRHSALYEKYNAAVSKLQEASEKYEKVVKKELAKIGKKKVTGIKVVAGKKQATVSWKSFGKKYHYWIIYKNTSKKGDFGGKSQITKNKSIIKNLKSGQKYQFRVMAYRPETVDPIGLPDVMTDASKWVTSSKIK